MSPDDPRHGTRRGYYAHRKADQPACLDCKRAAARAEATRQLHLMHGQHGRIDATGTRRRLQALVCLGWNWKALGALLGSDEVMVKRWAERDEPGSYVFRETAQRVAERYERLSMQFPPETTAAEKNAASRARNRARRNGWAPPLAWSDIDRDEAPDYGGPDTDIDPVVVMRLLEGQRVKATKAEKEAAMERWVADGGSRNELARWHGWKPERYTTHLRVVGEAS